MTVVAAFDPGLVNLSLCIMEKDDSAPLQRPRILHWENRNLYSDRPGGKVLKTESGDKVCKRVICFLDQIYDWNEVHEVYIENQAVSKGCIKRVADFLLAYFLVRYPTIKTTFIHANKKLSLVGMTHLKEEAKTYAQRKKLAIKYARQFLQGEPECSVYKGMLERSPRGHRGGVVKLDDVCDAALTTLAAMNLPITVGQ